MTCDKFQPVWSIFYTLFDRFWPEFRGQIYHCSENHKMDHPNVITINTKLPKGPSNWSSGLEMALQKIPSSHVILLLEDFFLNRKVDNKKVIEIYESMLEASDVKCVRLIPVPPPLLEDGLFTSEFGQEDQYRISTQPAIWEKNYLMSVLKKGDTPWQFELEGSERSKNMEGKILGVNKASARIMGHYNGIIRGKMTRESMKFLKEMDISSSKSMPEKTKLEEYYFYKAPN